MRYSPKAICKFYPTLRLPSCRTLIFDKHERLLSRFPILSLRPREWPTTSRINLSTLLAATGPPDAVRCIAKRAELQMPGADRAYIRLSRRSNVVQMRQCYQGKSRKSCGTIYFTRSILCRANFLVCILLNENLPYSLLRSWSTTPSSPSEARSTYRRPVTTATYTFRYVYRERCRREEKKTDDSLPLL